MNAFSLNLTYLKKHAKSRLKRIRSGSVKDLRWLLALHPQPLLPADSVKLADVHLALARELGVSSWSKLLSHIDSLDRNKSSDGAPLPALDDDLQTLHVRCGHDIQQTLEQAGFNGDFLPYIEPLCIGPLFLDEKTLSEIRAEYVSDRLLSEMKEVEKSLEQIKSEAKQATSKLLDNDYQRIVLWVEHDNYDQLMLIRSLYLLSYQNITKVEIIEVSTFPGRERFIGLGQLPPEALRALWNSRTKVSVEHITVATKVWPAFCSKSPLKLVEYYHKVDQGLFPNIREVIFRHLPHVIKVVLNRIGAPVFLVGAPPQARGHRKSVSGLPSEVTINAIGGMVRIAGDALGANRETQCCRHVIDFPSRVFQLFTVVAHTRKPVE